ENCLKRINGFFAMAIFDTYLQQLFIARDRIGIKPLVYFEDSDKFIFASDLNAITEFHINKTIDKAALFTYFQLNYIPQPKTIYANCKKLSPGSFININLTTVNNTSITPIKYYEIPFHKESVMQPNPNNYRDAKENLQKLITQSVEKRLVADVEVGGFLSGGIDSSIIACTAKKLQSNFQTFSIGFPDEPYFDETKYALAVAQKHQIKHTVFDVTRQQLYQSFQEIINQFDEPFADASALPVYLLSKNTKNHVKVALSGDGADELFGGYNKHFAEFKMMNPGIEKSMINVFSPLFNLLPNSRNNKMQNFIRKIIRFQKAKNLTRKERYWLWASILDDEETNYLLKESMVIKTQRLTDQAHDFKKLKDSFLKHITKTGTLNEVFFTDM